MTVIKRASRISDNKCVVILCSSADELKKYSLSATDIEYFRAAFSDERKTVMLNTPQGCLIAINKPRKVEKFKLAEGLRKSGAGLISIFNDNKCASAELVDATGNNEHLLLAAEGILLANYQFLKYKKDRVKETHSLKTIFIVSKSVNAKQVEELNIITEAIYISRTLVNEPVNFLTATQLSKEFQKPNRPSVL